MTLLVVIVASCLIALVAAMVITWAAGKSPFWNMRLAAVLVLGATVLLALAVIFLIRRIAPS